MSYFAIQLGAILSLTILTICSGKEINFWMNGIWEFSEDNSLGLMNGSADTDMSSGFPSFPGTCFCANQSVISIVSLT